jgi:hypothetical protein
MSSEDLQRLEQEVTEAEISNELSQAMVQVVDSLRGEAEEIALDIGYAKLFTEAGTKAFLEEMEKMVFPEVRDEAKDLYRVGTKTGDHHMLSRQPKESMRSYTKRRERWHNLITGMTQEYTFSGTMLGDLLLDNAGLSDIQRLLILSSTSNDKDFTKIKDALLVQHPKIHYGKKPDGKATGKGDHARKFRLQRPKFRNANYAEEEDWEDIGSEESDAGYRYDGIDHLNDDASEPNYEQDDSDPPGTMLLLVIVSTLETRSLQFS